MRRTPDARIHDDGQVDLVDQDLDEVLRGKPLVRSDGRAERHDRCSTGAHQVARDIQIGIHVGKHDEPFVRKHFGGLDGLVVVGQKILRITHDLDLHEVAAAKFPRQARYAHGLLCSARA